MSTRYPEELTSSDSDIDYVAMEGESSSKLFMNETISRDVNITNEPEGLLSSLSSKYDSSTLRLNNSQQLNQSEPQSPSRPPQGIPSGPGAAPPGLVPRRPGSPAAPRRPTPRIPPRPKLPQALPPGFPRRGGMPSGPPPPPPPPVVPRFPNSRKPPGWIGSPYGKNRPRGTYSTVKSSRSSKWRTKLQGSQGTIRNSSTENSLPLAGDAVSDVLGDGDDAGSCSDVNHRAPLEVDSLAESLSTLAEQHLNLDVLDQSKDVSNFISYLLDTIQMLEAEVKYKDADSESSLTGSDSDEENVPIMPAAPCYQTIHRIYCTNTGHNHNRSLFEDEPVAVRKSASSLSTRIEAKKKIENLESYLSKHRELCFIIIKEHVCAREQGNEMSHRQPDTTKRPSQRSERLAILSPLLQKALEQVAQYTLESSHHIVEDEIGMDAPYPFLFHHWEKLVELADDDAYGSVLTPLLGFLNDNYKGEYEEAVSMFDRGVVNARHLQKLFQPNHLVIFKTSDDLNVYALDDAPQIEKEWVYFTGWSYVYAEVDLKQKKWNTTMSPVGNEEVNISNLNVHPVRFGREEDLERLTRRGQAFWGTKGQHYTCYTGWDHRHDHYYSSARFMVDLATHQLMHPSKKLPKKHTRPSKIKWEDEITPETILLLPSTVYGFNLQEKKWVDLDVDKFHPVIWNEDAFDRLVLDQKTKEMIYALVDVQTATKKMDDIITGKGNGLIVLLHGSPGTGKTLTAESVAEIAKKPLYRVTCGDIGTQAQDVEKYLATVLYLGKLWDCVLLLDEADVFLEERTFADLQRNSLVSVFLRILEYYEGILILTSNRVGHFDEAFKSRIQVAIHYDNLSKRSRKAIWQNFLDMIENSTDEDANIAELEHHLDQLASEEMNGRQIRNAILTARQLAKHRNERLEWVHLDQVMKTSAAFNKYLKTVRGQSDDKIAREEGRR
ncbi:AAA family ATPase [Colletotrichum kahawae]|uniref:AAA family ATPase n=1 Tax=Colletotrichum kahawae TaxID=34407 RepID=A0AAD9YX74_COLKA|nr:AAA family ATPase [Colletotrichum kahawae]